MNANPPADITSKKPSFLARCAAFILHLLRLFWPTVLALLLVVIYGLRSGWSTPRQWSDGLFIAAVLLIMIGGITILGSSSLRAIDDAATARYIVGADVHETRLQIIMDYTNKRAFGLRAFIGALFITLIAWLVLVV